MSNVATGIVIPWSGGEDPAGLGAAYDDMVRTLTPAVIQQAAKTYFNSANYARFVLLPETPAAR